MKYSMRRFCHRLLATTFISLLANSSAASIQTEFAATALSVNRTSYCIWNSAGEALCRGKTNRQSAPEDLFPVAKISSAAGVSCAVGIAGELRCWGNHGAVVDGAPVNEGNFRDVAVGDGYACVIKQSGNISCWGLNQNNRLDAPGGNYSQLDAADQKACAVSTSGTVSCWGWNDLGVTDVPANLNGAIKVSVAGGVACALLDTGDISCWGRHSTFPNNGPYKDVAVGGPRYDYGNSFLCGLTLNGEIDCKLDPGDQNINPIDSQDASALNAYNSIPSGSGYTALALHSGEPNNTFEGCALSSKGELDCWASSLDTLPGEDNIIELVAPTGLLALIYSDTAAEIQWQISNTQAIARGMVSGYEILRNGLPRATTTNGYSYQFTDLIPGTVEHIAVRQLSESGAPGPLSATISIDTLNREFSHTTEQNGQHYSPPVRPLETAGLHALVYGPTSLELYWDRTEDINLAGYEIRRDGSALAFTSGTSYFDTVPETDKTYRYDVIAVLSNSPLMYGFSSIDVSLSLARTQSE